jgi:amino acid adenylation domain-containing protein
MTLPDGLSESARALLAQRSGRQTSAGPAASGGGMAPLSTPQLTQWLFSEVYSISAGAMPKTLHLAGALDRDALQRALTEIVRRHQLLRSVIVVEDGEPAQRVASPRPVELLELDVRRLPDAERNAAAEAVLDEAGRRPMDPGSDLLLRAVLARVGEEAFELQVSTHPLAFDGWSLGVFFRELGVLYSAFAAGLPSPLPELPLQYADYATWERLREGSAEFEADRAFWQERLAGSTTAIDLPTDRPRQRLRGLVEASASARVDGPLVSRLAELGTEEETTLFAVAFAAFQVLVARRAGLDDFVVGVVSANRPDGNTEALIGSFATMVPFRARLTGAPSFRTHLRRTGESLAHGLAHQTFPFQRLAADLRPGDAPGVDPLFQVVFNYRNIPAGLPAMDGIAVSNLRTPHLATAVDLHLNVTPGAGRLDLELDYDAELFHAATATRWLDGYRTLLEAIAGRPDLSVGDLPVMPASEVRLLESEWSGAGIPAPQTAFAIERFEATAAAQPGAPAVEHLGVSLSYLELRQRMDRLAARLRAEGAVPGCFIGVSAHRSVNTVAVLLAIMSIGAVYVPLDPLTPPRRLDALLSTVSLALIVTDASPATQLASRPEPVLYLPDLLAADEAQRPARRSYEVRTEDPAYVIFTSGSTGAPKGVAVGHGALASFVHAAAEYYSVGRGDRFLQFASLTFDVSLKEIFVPLAAGGTIVVRSEHMTDSAVAFAEECRALRLSHICVGTAFWHEIVAAEWPTGLDLGPGVRFVDIGGEATNPAAVRRWHAVAPPHIRLTNGYGPTETTIFSTSAELIRGEEYPSDVPIGRPIAGATVHVRDSHRHPVPIGAPGELWIGGANLALGYLNEPALTAARFRTDDAHTRPGERLYRTGDRVRWRDDGQLAYLGRIDRQMKLRGYRIEPAEIERVLCGVPGIRQAAVIIHPVGDRLVGVVVPEGKTVPSSRAIRDAASLELPAYMVPGQIVTVDRLPLASTGKVDRAVLASLVPATAESAGGHLATANEQLVARIWESVLGITGIGRDDRFLDLGGHSLLAMRVASRLQTELGVSVSLRTALTHPTVASLAGELDRLAREGPPRDPAPTIPRAPRTPRPAPPPTA